MPTLEDVESSVSLIGETLDGNDVRHTDPHLEDYQGGIETALADLESLKNEDPTQWTKVSMAARDLQTRIAQRLTERPADYQEQLAAFQAECEIRERSLAQLEAAAQALDLAWHPIEPSPITEDEALYNGQKLLHEAVQEGILTDEELAPYKDRFAYDMYLRYLDTPVSVA